MLGGFHVWCGKLALLANICKHLSVAKGKGRVPPNPGQTRQLSVPSASACPVLIVLGRQASTAAL